MGHLEEPGRYNKPDPDEYVRIRGDQLKERNGRYELRVTNELEEAVFADHFQLVAVDHPQGVEVYPNEGLTDPPVLSNSTRHATHTHRLPPWTIMEMMCSRASHAWTVSTLMISAAIAFAAMQKNTR